MPMLVSADEIADPVIENHSFHAPTIRNMIDVNLELENVDEEFYHLLTNAYLTDPELLAQTIADLPTEDITYLAKAISYDLQKTNRTTQATLPEDCGSAASNNAAALMYEMRNDPANATLMAFMGAETMTTIASRSIVPGDINSPYINVSMSSPGTPSVAAPTTVSVTVGSHSTVSYAQAYFFDIHKVVNGVDSVAATGRISIPANQLGTTVTRQITFNTAGNYTIYAVLKEDFQTEILESTRYSLSVNGKWHITVELPSNRNYKGTLTLYDASGTQIHQCECLGRSASGDPPNIYRGNTPTGECIGQLIEPDENEHPPYSYGTAYLILLTPISGDMKEYTNRSGFLIHGGDPHSDPTATSYPLRPTHGCIRVSNSDQLALQNCIESLITNSNHEIQGTVSITEYTFTG